MNLSVQPPIRVITWFEIEFVLRRVVIIGAVLNLASAGIWALVRFRAFAYGDLQTLLLVTWTSVLAGWAISRVVRPQWSRVLMTFFVLYVVSAPLTVLSVLSGYLLADFSLPFDPIFLFVGSPFYVLVLLAILHRAEAWRTRRHPSAEFASAPLVLRRRWFLASLLLVGCVGSAVGIVILCWAVSSEPLGRIPIDFVALLSIAGAVALVSGAGFVAILRRHPAAVFIVGVTTLLLAGFSLSASMLCVPLQHPEAIALPATAALVVSIAALCQVRSG